MDAERGEQADEREAEEDDAGMTEFKEDSEVFRKYLSLAYHSLDDAWRDALDRGYTDIADRIWGIMEDARELSNELESRAYSDVEDSIHRLAEYYKDTLNELSKEE